MWNKKSWILVGRLTILVVLTAVCRPLLAQSEDPVVTQYQDWQLLCAADEGDCVLFQALNNPDKPGVIYAVNISMVSDKATPVMQLSFPLGIYLARDIGVSVQALQKDIPMTVCLPSGCKAILPIDDELLRALKLGRSIAVRFYTTSEKPNEIRFSLDDFTAGYEALLDQE